MSVFICDKCRKIYRQKGTYEVHLTICHKLKTRVDITKPPLKWVGGKTQIIDKVLDTFPREMTHYHEPFLGGGSVLLAVLNYRQQKLLYISGSIYASDVNPRVIHLYQHIQGKVDELIVELNRIINGCPKEEGEIHRAPKTAEEAHTSPESYYYWIRQRFNQTPKDSVEVAHSAMFLYLNKTCFRGVYREGPNGFNVPFGHYKNPGIFEEDALRSLSTLLQGVVFSCQPFQDSLSIVQEGDFVYMDPPYAPEQANSFVGYTSAGFGIADHADLFQRCKQMADLRIRWTMSNADVDLVKKEFVSPAFTTVIIDCRRAIHSTKPETKTKEVLIYPVL